MATKNEKKEVRTFEFRIGEERKMQGHAAVFNQETDLGWFREKIEAGAFKHSIKHDDVRALFNHDPNYVLGRNTAGTLRMSEDEVGLKISIDPPDTQYARDLAVSIERGDITQMSFAFEVLEEAWVRGEKKGQPDIRTLKKVRLYDVSPVTYPAYEGTDVAMRSHDEWEKNLPLPPPEGDKGGRKLEEEKQTPEFSGRKNRQLRKLFLKKYYQ